jgi:hypothetical protein
VTYEKLRRALDAGLFDPELCEIVAPPSEADITRAEHALGITFSLEHRGLLLEWGGSDLHEIVIHAPDQVHVNQGLVEFAGDYAGNLFHYAPGEGGAVYADDVQRGETILLAASLPEFINEVLLGAKGEDFYGEDWVRELKVLGLA